MVRQRPLNLLQGFPSADLTDQVEWAMFCYKIVTVCTLYFQAKVLYTILEFATLLCSLY